MHQKLFIPKPLECRQTSVITLFRNGFNFINQSVFNHKVNSALNAFIELRSVGKTECGNYGFKFNFFTAGV